MEQTACAEFPQWKQRGSNLVWGTKIDIFKVLGCRDCHKLQNDRVIVIAHLDASRRDLDRLILKKLIATLQTEIVVIQYSTSCNDIQFSH